MMLVGLFASSLTANSKSKSLQMRVTLALQTPALRMTSTGITVSISSAPLDRITNALLPAMVSLLMLLLCAKTLSSVGNFQQQLTCFAVRF